jgi:SMC interacting uncharacterized protein involved in chromosome segregation
MSEKIKEILVEYKTKSNKDLVLAMDFLSKEFDNTKHLVIELTKKIDKIETTYNKILKEYESRKG